MRGPNFSLADRTLALRRRDANVRVVAHFHYPILLLFTPPALIRSSTRGPMVHKKRCSELFTAQDDNLWLCPGENFPTPLYGSTVALAYAFPYWIALIADDPRSDGNKSRIRAD